MTQTESQIRARMKTVNSALLDALNEAETRPTERERHEWRGIVSACIEEKGRLQQELDWGGVAA